MTRLRLAVIGTGHLGRIHARLAAANPAFELVAVVDPVPAAREGLAAELGVAALAEHRPLLDKIDAAIIATPTRFHHRVARELLTQGIHLLVEKPLTASADEADELVALAAQSGATLQVGHIERFSPLLSAVAGEIGEPKYIEARRYSTHTLRSLDIGVVLDLMIHDLDVVLSLVKSPVIDIAALGMTVIGPHEDMATARVTFANGCVANLSASRVSFHACREMQLWSERGFVGLDFAARSAKVIRPAAAIAEGTFDPESLPAEERATFKDRLFTEYLPVQSVTAPERNALADEQTDFAEAILHRRAPRVSGEQGRDVVVVAQRVMQAIAAHAWDGHAEGRLGPRAIPGAGPKLSPPPSTLPGPHWQTGVPTAPPRRQAG